MNSSLRSADRTRLPRQLTPVAVPIIGCVLLAASWGRDLNGIVVAVVLAGLLGTVLIAVHHAEVVAHRIGETFGALVLAIAVTVIEAALIVSLMISDGDKAASLARDTVFAAVMIVCNGIVGVCILIGSFRRPIAQFQEEGATAILVALISLATLSLVLPRFTSGSPGPTFSGPQLAFAAISSAAVYGVFVFVQSVQHREAFLPVDVDGEVIDGDGPGTDELPAARTVALSVLLLAVSLTVVVGLAKSLSPSIERGVSSIGAPQAVVGVMIALLVLLPESVASFRAAARDRMQISLNLALGSGLASIGLTIPTIAVASIWLDGPILLGLGEKEIVLLVLTAFVSIVTFDAGKATILQAALHLMIFAAFIFLAFNP